jgi:hypothetical protein
LEDSITDMLAITQFRWPPCGVNELASDHGEQWSIESVQPDPQLSSTDDYFIRQCNGPPIWQRTSQSAYSFHWKFEVTSIWSWTS